jgi:integrase
MANLKVTLVRQCKTEKGWRRYPAVIGKNGRVKPGVVLVDGEERTYPGHYELRSYVGSKMVYKKVEGNASDALAARDRALGVALAKDTAVAVGATLIVDEGRTHLHRHLSKFLLSVKDRGADVAADVYRLAVEHFIQVSGCQYVDQIKPEHIQTYHRTLRKDKSDRTVHNRHMNLLAFLRYCGIEVATLGAIPRYEKTVPEIYDDDALVKFFGFLKDEKHKVFFELLLSTGLREQEAMYLEWPDLSPSTATITIHSKPKYKFKIKDKEERSVPVSDALLARLLSIRGDNVLIFPTKSGIPNTKLLRMLKTLVRKAGLNCGHCKSCIERQECERWFLHKFRATYCTKLLRAGLDLRTVMHLMGHADLASTMRYLRPAEDVSTKAAVNSISWIS